MSNSTPDVAIIGAGLGGLALALSLHAHNIPCTLYETRPAPSADASKQISYFTPNGDGGYLALAPNALRVLDRLGAYEGVRDGGFNYDEIHMQSARSMKLIGTVRSHAEGKEGYRSVRVGRGLVRRILLDKAEERGVKIVFGAKLVDLKETKDGVDLQFGDETLVTATLVVGADGMHSKVRDAVEPGATPRYSGQTGVGGPVSTKQLGELKDGLHMPCMLLGRGNSFAFMPCTNDGGTVSVFATMQIPDRSREEWATFMHDKVTLKKLLTDRHSEGTEWPPAVVKACQEIDQNQISAWPTYRLPPLSKYTSGGGRVVIIGDAAHGIPPHAGQGAGMAFEDAATLADKIAAGRDGGLEPLLAEWQGHRMERIKRVIDLTAQSGAARRASPTVFHQVIKEWLMAAYLWWNDGASGMDWLYGYDTKAL